MGKRQTSEFDTESQERIKPLGFISPLACIGEPPEHRDFRWKILREEYTPIPPQIDPTAIIEAFVTVDSGISMPTHVGEYAFLMKHCHIGHDAWIGNECNIAPGAIVGGFCKIGERVKIGLGALIRPRISIGLGAVIGAGAVVVKDVPAGEVWVGNPARNIHYQTDEEIWMEWFESRTKPREHLEGI